MGAKRPRQVVKSTLSQLEHTSGGSVMAEEQRSTMGLWRVVASVLASFLGVQSNRNRERDFQYGKPSHYIIIGLAFVTLFVLLLVGIVEVVMKFAAP